MTEIIKKGDKIKIEYTGKLADGSVFDSSEGKAPLGFEVGSGQVIPGFDKAVEGMKEGEEKTFTLKVEEAYGPVRDDLVQKFPVEKLPKEPKPEVGMMLMMQAPTGQQIPAKIKEVNEKEVTLDINHPLAGKDLTFEIKIVSINAPEDEKEDKKEEDNEEAGCSDCSSCSGCGN